MRVGGRVDGGVLGDTAGVGAAGGAGFELRSICVRAPMSPSLFVAGFTESIPDLYASGAVGNIQFVGRPTLSLVVLIICLMPVTGGATLVHATRHGDTVGNKYFFMTK